jgi:mono/diheme cytochrome c family protein
LGQNYLDEIPAAGLLVDRCTDCRQFSSGAGYPVSHGQSLVTEFCARCHAIGIKGESPHPWAPPFRTLGRIVDLNEFPRALERGNTSIHPDMPAIKFSQEEARAVRAYLWAIQQ